MDSLNEMHLYSKAENVGFKKVRLINVRFVRILPYKESILEYVGMYMRM